MKTKKVTHNDKFFIIHNECFHYEQSDVVKKEGVDDRKFIQYQWVIPMYVYSINQIFDGSENFDLCPVDCDKMKDAVNGWKWRRSFQYSSIGKEVFYTEKEAWKVYNRKYSDENKKVYEEFRRLRFVQEKSAELI
jgi:hypothetical protein